MTYKEHNEHTNTEISQYAETYLQDRINVLEFFYKQDYCFYGEFKNSSDLQVTLDEALSHIKAIETAINEYYFGEQWKEQDDKFWIVLLESIDEITQEKTIWFMLSVPECVFSQVDDTKVADLAYHAFQSQEFGHFVDGEIVQATRSKSDLEFYQAYNYILDDIIDPMHFITKVLRKEAHFTEHCRAQ